MKRRITLAVVVLAALVQVATAQSRPAIPAPPVDLDCDISDLVRLAGEVVGDPVPVQIEHECLSTRQVCAEQQAAWDATQHAILMFRLAHTVKLCRYAGY